MLDPVIIGAGLNLLSGIFGRRRQRKADAANAALMRESWDRQEAAPAKLLMSQAEGALAASAKTGFNPLTLLGVMPSTGGQSFTPVFNGNDAFADSLSTIGNWFSQAPRDRMAERVDSYQRARMLQESGLSPFRSHGYGTREAAPMSPTTFSAPQLASSRTNGLPKVNGVIRDSDGQFRMPVFDPNGRMVNIPVDVGQRLGLEPFGNLTAGDWTELKGEVIGETEVTVTFDKVSDHITGRGIVGGNKSTMPSQPVPKRLLGPALAAPKNKKPGFWDYWGMMP